jgi:hypothetical protein
MEIQKQLQIVYHATDRGFSMTKKKLIVLNLQWLLALLVVLTYGCSSPNSDAPRTDQTHPEAYILDHGLEANTDLTSCTVCHGTNFTGTVNPVPSCFSCHTDGPPFGIHPLPYTDPRDHGSAAKTNQTACRSCHGEALNNFDGGIVGDPTRFNKSAGTCSTQACHPAAKAHPTNWQGANDDRDPSYDSSHRTINEDTVINSCTLCHKTDGPGAGPMPAAPSCFSANFTNSDGITSGCHSGGYTVASHDIPYAAAVLHGTPSKADLADCQDCHGIPGTIQFDSGTAATGCSTAQCHPAAIRAPSSLTAALPPPVVPRPSATRQPVPIPPVGRELMMSLRLTPPATAPRDLWIRPARSAIMSR